MEYFNSLGQVNLRDAIIHLSKNNLAIQALEQVIGKKNIADAIQSMKNGDLNSNIGIAVHDFFIDEIINESKAVWRGVIIGSDEDEYPVVVAEYCGVYFVDAVDSDRICYFLSLSEAINVIKLNWNGSLKEDK